MLWKSPTTKYLRKFYYKFFLVVHLQYCHWLHSSRHLQHKPQLLPYTKKCQKNSCFRNIGTQMRTDIIPPDFRVTCYKISITLQKTTVIICVCVLRSYMFKSLPKIRSSIRIFHEISCLYQEFFTNPSYKEIQYSRTHDS